MPTSNPYTRYASLLRAVNVGGTGKLPMADLKAMCEELGFEAVQTYIASGNVVFTSALTAGQAQSALEAALLAYAGKPVAVFVRTGAQLQAIVARNPYPQAAPAKVSVVFLHQSPTPADLQSPKGQSTEAFTAGEQVLYIHYPDGMGVSKLRLPALDAGTARNMNTVAKLAQMVINSSCAT
jgi:uncharacterized protein (DUF1697 family)